MAQDDPATDVRLVNVPNLLCFIRLVGSFVLVILAWHQHRVWLFAAIVFLAFTDWLDGKIARWWGEQTRFGARLDSVTDATFYGAVLVSLAWMEGPLWYPLRYLIAAAVVSYAVQVGAALLKFGTIPSYHTRLAKTSWLLVNVAVAFMLLSPWRWPAVVALLVVVVTNIEMLAMTLVLDRQRTDVPSVFHARRIARGERCRKA